jgi:hypothetical protein
MRTAAFVVAWVVLASGRCLAQTELPAPDSAPPSAAQQIFQTAQAARPRSEVFASVGGAVVKPFSNEYDFLSNGIPPLRPYPWNWVVQAQVGFRMADDVSWFFNVEYQDFHDSDGNPFPLLYLDFDRLSAARFCDDLEVRWLVGLRLYDFGIGPHVGLVTRLPMGDSGLAVAGKLDVGYLIPITGHFRAELGLAWQPPRTAGLSVAAGAMVESTWFGPIGGVGPGVFGRVSWLF